VIGNHGSRRGSIDTDNEIVSSTRSLVGDLDWPGDNTLSVSPSGR
jgi:hypothetical protein